MQAAEKTSQIKDFLYDLELLTCCLQYNSDNTDTAKKETKIVCFSGVPDTYCEVGFSTQHFRDGVACVFVFKLFQHLNFFLHFQEHFLKVLKKKLLNEDIVINSDNLNVVAYDSDLGTVVVEVS